MMPCNKLGIGEEIALFFSTERDRIVSCWATHRLTYTYVTYGTDINAIQK